MLESTLLYLLNQKTLKSSEIIETLESFLHENNQGLLQDLCLIRLEDNILKNVSLFTKLKKYGAILTLDDVFEFINKISMKTTARFSYDSYSSKIKYLRTSLQLLIDDLINNRLQSSSCRSYFITQILFTADRLSLARPIDNEHNSNGSLHELKLKTYQAKEIKNLIDDFISGSIAYENKLRLVQFIFADIFLALDNVEKFINNNVNLFYSIHERELGLKYRQQIEHLKQTRAILEGINELFNQPQKLIAFPG